MTDGIKIPVSADVSQVNASLNQVDKSVDKVGKTAERVGRSRINLIDEKAIDASLKRLEKRFDEFFRNIDKSSRRVGTGLGGGPGGAGGGSGNGSNIMPPSLRLPPPSLPPSVRGPQQRLYRYTNAPDIYDVGRGLVGGFGGGFGQVASYATRGARAGYRDERDAGGGGFGGGMAGLLKGAGIGALAYGAFKIGGAVNEGYDMAKDRAMSVDTLKRQMGDLGVSFDILKLMTNEAATGMGVNSKESAELALELNKLNRGADRTAEALLDSVRVSAGTSRAYGLDPGVGARFFGGMRGIDPKQNNRELALLLAEAINKSGMSARADEMMQIMQSFAASSARLSLTSPNMAAYGGAFSSLMGKGYAGMTPDVAASILGQANSSISNMGAAGEAGQNFTMAAFQRAGAINPIMARALAEGGMFGTRRGVFGSGPLASYFGNDAAGLAGGPGADVMNIDAIRQHLDRQGLGKSLKLDAFRNYTGVSSLSNAAALYQMDTTSLGGLSRVLAEAGVDINSFNERGIQGLAGIGSANGAGLRSIASQYLGRSGKGSLSADEKSQLTGAMGMGDEDLRKALIRIAATKDQEETTASKLRDQIKSLEDVQIDIGDKLLVPITIAKDALLFLAGGGRKSQREIVAQMATLEYNDQAAPLKGQKSAIEKRIDDAQRRLRNMEINQGIPFITADPANRKRLEDQLAGDKASLFDVDKQLKDLEAQRDMRSANGSLNVSAQANITSHRDRLAAIEKQYGLPSGMLMGVWGAESTYGTNAAAFSPNGAGAMGHFQFMPGTAKQYGVSRNDFDSEATGAGRYLSDLYRQHGSWDAALAAYNGAISPDKRQDYLDKVHRLGSFGSEEQAQIPEGSRAAPGQAVGDNVIHIKVDGELKGRGGEVGTFTAQTAVPLPRGTGTRK